MAYKRSILLINKPFQLRFSFYVCSWLFALSLIYPWIIQAVFSSFLEYVKLDPRGPELARLKSLQGEMSSALIFLQVGFLMVTFLVSIFLSHRIAGPLFKLRKFFAAAKAGNYTQRIQFRKADHFQELAESYNEMMDRLGGTLLSATENLDQVIKQLEQAAQKPGAPKDEIEKSISILRETRKKTAPVQAG